MEGVSLLILASWQPPETPTEQPSWDYSTPHVPMQARDDAPVLEVGQIVHVWKPTVYRHRTVFSADNLRDWALWQYGHAGEAA